ncbi:hypothetical protein FRUB_05983 [Fimbriiglobus ruber]|uniref:Uncharacterized protein n=1 Tax=Fimbriiglobus ruber TaxID=1908690 RepID=A0A225DCY1_9BACT|nr:hypothetical protein FRUB_05983 [Fimbriiglobus ruber]
MGELVQEAIEFGFETEEFLFVHEQRRKRGKMSPDNTL